MSEEHLETLVKTMENSNVQKVGVAGEMDDFWDDCVEAKQQQQIHKKQNISNKKFNPDEEDVPDDYITCNLNFFYFIFNKSFIYLKYFLNIFFYKFFILKSQLSRWGKNYFIENGY